MIPLAWKLEAGLTILRERLGIYCCPFVHRRYRDSDGTCARCPA